MSSRKVMFVVLLLIVSLLSACASNSTQIPASQRTGIVVSATFVSQTQAPAKTVAATEVSTATSGDTPAAAESAVSFSKDIVPILDNSCINCHGGDRIEEGLKLQTYNDIFAGSNNGAVVVPGDASNSLLAELVANHKMPKRGSKLTDPQVQLITDWINQGALNN